MGKDSHQYCTTWANEKNISLLFIIGSNIDVNSNPKMFELVDLKPFSGVYIFMRNILVGLMDGER